MAARSCIYPLVAFFIASVALGMPQSDLLAKPQHATKPSAHHTSSAKKTAHKKKAVRRVAHKPRKSARKVAARAKSPYALGMFMWAPPASNMKLFDEIKQDRVSTAFRGGCASDYTPTDLVRAGVFTNYPLKGGIYKRREKISHIILHSTETERPADGKRVVRSWNRGMRHPGAQYVIERDGTILQTVDPEYATVHVNVYRTLFGVNNDNSIGIEIVRSGADKYTQKQLASVTRLVSYLQQRYDVSDDLIYGHGQIQPSTRTDPVNFDWTRFVASRNMLRAQAMAPKKLAMPLAKDTPSIVKFFQTLTSPAFN